MISTPRPAARRLVLMVAPVAVLALSGCGAPEAGAAAVVGDRRISVAEVQSAYTDILPVVGADAQLSQSQVLDWLIWRPYVLGAAQSHGLGVSPSDAEEQFRTSDKDPHPSWPAIEAVQSVLAFNKLQAGALPSNEVDKVFTGIIDQVTKDGVKVNPRYGSSYDASHLAILNKTPNWLPQPTPSASQAVPDDGSGQGQDPTEVQPPPDTGSPTTP